MILFDYQKLRDFRAAAGYTVEYVAEQLRMSARTLESWENKDFVEDVKNLEYLNALVGFYGHTLNEITNEIVLH